MVINHQYNQIRPPLLIKEHVKQLKKYLKFLINYAKINDIFILKYCKIIVCLPYPVNQIYLKI